MSNIEKNLSSFILQLIIIELFWVKSSSSEWTDYWFHSIHHVNVIIFDQARKVFAPFFFVPVDRSSFCRWVSKKSLPSRVGQRQRPVRLWLRYSWSLRFFSLSPGFLAFPRSIIACTTSKTRDLTLHLFGTPPTLVLGTKQRLSTILIIVLPFSLYLFFFILQNFSSPFPFPFLFFIPFQHEAISSIIYCSDHLAGTSVYGTLSNNPKAANHWSVAFNSQLTSNTLMVFANGLVLLKKSQ